jgi:hypothetical protein
MCRSALFHSRQQPAASHSLEHRHLASKHRMAALSASMPAQALVPESAQELVVLLPLWLRLREESPVQRMQMIVKELDRENAAAHAAVPSRVGQRKRRL